jgi:hypothetical protein
MAASYGPKPTLVLSEPVAKRGSEVADSSVMTSAEEGSDLDEETARNRTSGRTLRLEGGDHGKEPYTETVFHRCDEQEQQRAESLSNKKDPRSRGGQHSF